MEVVAEELSSVLNEHLETFDVFYTNDEAFMKENFDLSTVPDPLLFCMILDTGR